VKAALDTLVVDRGSRTSRLRTTDGGRRENPIIWSIGCQTSPALEAIA
jgi:hypothetical protein